MSKRLLVIEDDVIKASNVTNFMLKYGGCVVDQRYSYNSGLLALMNEVYELCILDMSLPTYDVSLKDGGYETIPYAGDLLLRQMKRRKREIPTVVLTQYTTFLAAAGGEKTLTELSSELQRKYPTNYLGCVFYADGETSWQNDIENIISDILTNGHIC